jgi:fucose 4-O-acetylase-like acetyltransferase
MGFISHGQDKNSSSRGRIEWVDVAKGIGIFLVVFGHNLGGLRESGILRDDSWVAFTEGYIYVFHMPLFFFLAGIFVAGSARRTFQDYLINKASGIIYPYFLWSLAEVSVQIFASRYTNNHLSIFDLVKIAYQPIDQYWFLYAIFLMYLTYWLVSHLSISNGKFLLFSAMLYAVEALGLNIVRWDVFHAYCNFMIYFALGSKVVETSSFTRLVVSKEIKLAGLAIGGYLLIALGVAFNTAGLPFLHAMLAIAGTTATIALSLLICDASVCSILRILGVYSLEIYVSHTIFASGARIVMQREFGYTGPLLHLVVGTALGICIPILLAIWGPKVGLPNLFTWSRSRRTVEIAAIKLPAA